MFYTKRRNKAKIMQTKKRTLIPASLHFRFYTCLRAYGTLALSAPITEPLPIVTPGTIITPPPIQQPSSMVTGSAKVRQKHSGFPSCQSGFAPKIRANRELEPVERHGEQPQILKFDKIENEISCIVNLISSFKKSDYKHSV
jgi:hypothetical protein